ncbi:YceD family protein [Acidithiobacillus ferrianus]|uniref:Large ribosomal RNA subunit accumulation protein YceD n=2 Tax=Acidithiobacillus ferrianus TaxID=2678518 RepID=A0A845U7J3_9PROT|nr:YceD family protein [Acidithiobacillus ferrianus]NDU41727.1 hypothetical protein [Acidithiobacillus ferrianus]
MFSAKASNLPLARVSVQGDRLSGAVDLSVWMRLSEALVSVRAVNVSIDLIRRGQVVTADGGIEVIGEIPCARCLGAMPLQLTVPVHTGLAELESAVAALDPELEAVLAERGAVALQNWLEDEVLLALPMIPRCAEWVSGVCAVSGLEPLQCVG